MRDLVRLYRREQSLQIFMALILWVGILGAAIIFAEIMAGHYWLNLSAWLVALLCFLVPLMAVPLVVFNEWISDRNRPPSLWLFAIVVSLICLLITLWLFVQGGNILHDLWHGPVYGSGVVERAQSFCGKGCTFSVTIQGVDYRVPDWHWWLKLLTGEKIEFWYGARTHYAYPLPQQK